MSLIDTELLNYLPFKRKLTLSGWLSFDAPCCIHNGESADTRQRGGFISHPSGGFSYHCFNCGFKTSWQPGRQITFKNKKFFNWINVPDSKINEWTLNSLKLLDSKENNTSVYKEFVTLALPIDSVPLKEALGQYQLADQCLEYVKQRGFSLEDYDWHYCPLPGYAERIIIPFYHNKKLVGYTARKITNGSPKYLSESQSGYVFNIDNQKYTNKFLVVTEGPFDALSVSGVAILTNEPNQQQTTIINSLAKTVIVVPDRDYAGMKLVRHAMNNNWLVSIPSWEDDIKDLASAVERYGKIFCLKDIVDTATDSAIKLEMFIKKYPKENTNEK